VVPGPNARWWPDCRSAVTVASMEFPVDAPELSGARCVPGWSLMPAYQVIISQYDILEEGNRPGQSLRLFLGHCIHFRVDGRGADRCDAELELGVPERKRGHAG
jgi:hypothetical protein